MWDQETLDRMNREWHREAVSRARESVIQARTGKPLNILANKLRFRQPPSLSTLVSYIEEHEYFVDFLKIVDEFLPEEKQAILQDSKVEDRISAFARAWEKKYFPLESGYGAGEVDSYASLTTGIPLVPLGFGSEEYTELIQGDNIGIQLMTFLFEHPYGDKGDRVALGDNFTGKVPRELLLRIPEDGFMVKDLHSVLNCTKYADIAMWGDAINLSTGNQILNVDLEMYAESNLPPWDKENVEFYDKEWDGAMEHQKKTYAMASKFHENPAGFLKEVLDFIDKRQEAKDAGRKRKDAERRAARIPVGASGRYRRTAQ